MKTGHFNPFRDTHLRKVRSQLPLEFYSCKKPVGVALPDPSLDTMVSRPIASQTMTRCLNCGAERDADQCLACGLTSAAAEVMLRGRLVRRTALFLLGAVLFVPVSQAFPPLELDSIMIFVGVLFFAVLGLGLWMIQRARARKEIEVLKRIYFGLLPLPWILSALLFVNGKLDTSPPQVEQTSVVSKFRMPGVVLRTQRLIVVSWRPDRRVERVMVALDDYDRFQIGDAVVVQVGRGVAGIPWIYGVYRP
jgi:hypothetical protein